MNLFRLTLHFLCIIHYLCNVKDKISVAIKK
nr:MAG TPA: hypothetical protein [Caudoviricetes sp.]